MLVEEPIVLLVDDSEDDARLVRGAFERAGLVAPLQVARDGEEVIAYLRGDGAYADRTRYPLPTALLLDLNLPRQDGFAVLAWIRGQPAHKRLGVYVLSASSRAADIQHAYDLGANSFLVKPGTQDELTLVAQGLLAWLRLIHVCAPDEISSGQLAR
jgi:CheY-like chemotaxis protein